MRRRSSEIEGEGSGIVMVAAMSGVWTVIGLYLHWAPLVFVLVIPAVLVMLGVKYWRTSEQLRLAEPPLTAEESAAERRLFKRFIWIFAAEGIAILLLVNVLNNTGTGRFFIPAFGMVVGLHFLPLAAVYRRPLFYATGVAQVLLCVVAAILWGGEPERLRTVTGLGMALTLWATIGVMLNQTPMHQSRESSSEVSS